MIMTFTCSSLQSLQATLSRLAEEPFSIIEVLGNDLPKFASFYVSFILLKALADLPRVLLQVGVFKATKGPDGVGRRLFRMAPFHHHLEACGWHETQVVAAAYAASLGLALLAIAVAAV